MPGWIPDHVPPSATGSLDQLELAAVLGAVVLEKHFTDNKQLQGWITTMRWMLQTWGVSATG